MKVKKINIIIVSVIGTLSVFAYLKFGINYNTPDELFYVNPNELPVEISFKFLITRFILSNLYSINQYLLPVINITIVAFVLKFFYINHIKNKKIVSYSFLLIIFLLPSVLYFASAYLRDFYIYLISLLFFFTVNTKPRITVYLIVLLSILRYEAGVILVLSILIEKLILRKRLIVFNKYNILIIIAFFWIVLFVLIKNDFIFNQFYDLVSRYEKSTVGFSIFQLPITKKSVLTYSLPNWAAYWMPFLFKPLKAVFDYFFLIDSIVILILIIRFIYSYSIIRYKTDKSFRIATLLFLFTFFLSLPESLPETIIRHHMAYLPALLYLNFPIKRQK